MGQAFYRKYRSKTLDEVVGQNHLTTILKNSLKSGNLSHAYLFTGPRGVGKTSVARILAKEVNGLEPDDTNFYPDIIEIDAASNRRIEEIRELRDKIAIAPSQLKYKVYIVDEVHMLTREAFNALLKTLEEPPAHAIFILATTDFHKVPDTITSRCMRLNFKMISNDDLISSLKDIAKKEKISIDAGALDLIAEYSEGSFRDALSLLDQMSSLQKNIDLNLVELTLGIANKQSIIQLIQSITESNIQKIIQQIQEMIDSGATPSQINKQLSRELRKLMLTNTSDSLPASQAMQLIENLNHMYSFQDQKIALELAVLKVISLKDNNASEPEFKKEEFVEEKYQEEKIIPNIPLKPLSKKSTSIIGDDAKLWDAVLARLKTENNTLYGIARMADASLEQTTLTLAFKFPFHLKQMNLQKNKNLVEKILMEVKSDMDLAIVLLDEKSKNIKPHEKLNQKTSDDLKSISNIFGPSEVLES